MKTCYINSAVAISAQDTFEKAVLVFKTLEEGHSKLEAVYPEFKNYIKPTALRRMSKAVKMGVSASSIALEQAEITQPDTILTGTGMGCIADTETFLDALIANDEDYLTPTAFIQSTHNTVGAQIALGLKCKSYNNTYVNANVSFESALLDAKLCLELEDYKTALVGGVDELSKTFSDLQLKVEKNQAKPKTVLASEGATFFGLSTENKSNSVILKGIEINHYFESTEIENSINSFLKKHNINEVDAIITGHTGDAFDKYYDKILNTSFINTTQLSYKNLVGDYFTVSAFALFLGYHVLINQNVPEGLHVKNNTEKGFKNVLLYNQNKGKDHSFILLSLC
jgi:3-oxoacyl-[acyl-carrier-protein] synthase II